MESRTFITFVLALSTFSPLTIADPRQRIEDVDKNAITIAAVIEQIQLGLVIAKKTLTKQKMPALQKVELSLQTVVSKKGGPEFKFFIVSFGKKWNKDRIQEISINLIPPTLNASEEVSHTNELAESLASAVVSAARGVENARTGDYPLVLYSLKTTFKFIVRTGTKGGLGFKIVPVTFDFNGSIDKQAIQRLSVTFKKHGPSEK